MEQALSFMKIASLSHTLPRGITEFLSILVTFNI